MSKKHRTDFQIKEILKYNKDGSPDAQSRRHQFLMRMVKELQENRGYGQRWDVHKLGKKEVSRLVNDWRARSVGHKAIANNMVHIRWLAAKVNRADQIPSNKDIGVALRKSHPNYGKNQAVELDRTRLMVLGEREQFVTLLRSGLGLRTEEAVKFSYRYAMAIEGDYIRLKGSWTKGGKPRVIEIVTDEQREILERVGAFQAAHGDKSMIPRHRTFKSYYRDYNEAREKAGIAGHGLRHQWAQERFEHVSGGIKAPHAGGPKYDDLNDEQRARWRKAAKVVNHELGHGEGRHDITMTYIGRG